MTSPTHIQMKYWIYPIGNTPAVNLLRDTPPFSGKDEIIRILCLACGDPRSIFFTLWCEEDRARNVILFTLVVDTYRVDTNSTGIFDSCWNLFYHMLIPESDLRLLREHAKKLMTASESLEKWLASSYGQYVQYVNKDTLTELRGYWTQYHSINIAGKIDTHVREGLAHHSKQNKDWNVMHGLRSAGPLWPKATEILPQLYRKYWESGVVGATSTDVERLGKGGRGCVNPMFAVSSAPGTEFAVHYGSEPLLGFHLAEAFHSFVTEYTLDIAAKIRCLVSAAKDQFRAWCVAFAGLAKSHRVAVQLFSGDAVTLCHEIQSVAGLDRQLELPRAYTRQWKLQPLHFDGCISRRDSGRSLLDCFDVIDTSNLGDHIGLINLVVAAAPLLKSSPTSVLYTESLLAVSDNSTTSLATSLCSDVATFSLLIGLAPLGLLTGTTLEGVSNEAALQLLIPQGGSIGGQKQLRLRVPWKTPNGRLPVNDSAQKGKAQSILRVEVNDQGLAEYLFNVYKAMFAQEDLSTLFSRMQRMATEQYATDLQKYTRAAIVAFMRLVKMRVLTDWKLMIKQFLFLVENDRSLLVGSNSLQELYMHLALSDVWTISLLSEGPYRAQQTHHLSFRSRTNEKGVLAEADPPPIVYIAMTVPRNKLKVFTDSKADAIGTPGLHISVKQRQGQQNYENCYFSFHCFFGRVLQNTNDNNGSIVEESDEGWQGSADLVVVCPVPAWGLLTGPQDGLTVALVINTNPENIARFQSQFGLQLTIFETALSNVVLWRTAPYLRTEQSATTHQQSLQALYADRYAENIASSTFDAHHSLKKLQTRKIFTKGSGESNALASGATVAVLPVNSFTVDLKVGNASSHCLTFPFIVQTRNLKTRIAEKSSWVEVEAAMHGAVQEDSFDNWTRVRCGATGPTYAEYLPRIRLDIQPRIPFQKTGSQWLNMFMGGMASSQDAEIDRGNLVTNPKRDLKQSLGNMFLGFAGLHFRSEGRPVRTFQLSRDESCHTIIFVSEMRHDLDLGSIVLDAWVLPLTIPRVHKLRDALRDLMGVKPIGTNVSDSESILWKRLLPALAERCRTWSHTAQCEYRQKGTIPLSTEEDQSPLCSCGEGKVPSDFAKLVKEWKPFAKYVTRIAIAPVFPVPYVESLSISDAKDAQLAQDASCDTCGKRLKELKACGGCGKVRYCGKECQKAGWKEHKRVCGK
ncbi:MAG: hypothetical protein LQ352_006916 [Teloschistes flavicans]|nr:MAG: hypothetical protein LQ352_006916 [Teloschistes flavicans]